MDTLTPIIIRENDIIRYYHMCRVGHDTYSTLGYICEALGHLVREVYIHS